MGGGEGGQNLVDEKNKALGEEARAKGKHFGRSTPQYGSYGAIPPHSTSLCSLLLLLEHLSRLTPIF